MNGMKAILAQIFECDGVGCECDFGQQLLRVFSQSVIFISANLKVATDTNCLLKILFLAVIHSCWTDKYEFAHPFVQVERTNTCLSTCTEHICPSVRLPEYIEVLYAEFFPSLTISYGSQNYSSPPVHNIILFIIFRIHEFTSNLLRNVCISKKAAKSP